MSVPFRLMDGGKIQSQMNPLAPPLLAEFRAVEIQARLLPGAKLTCSGVVINSGRNAHRAGMTGASSKPDCCGCG